MKSYIFDNGGKTLDRYTILTYDGNVFGASENPFHGFGQFCNHVIENIEPKYASLFYDKINGKYLKSATIRYKRKFINEARKNHNWLGKEINENDLPFEAKKYFWHVNDRFIEVGNQMKVLSKSPIY